MTTTRLRPVKSVADYGAALSRIEVLMEIEGRSDLETDELEVLAVLVEMYEDAEFPMSVPSPIAAIKFRMEQLEMSQSDLAPVLGSRAKVSEILNGKRPLTLKMIRALHEHLNIPAALLIKEGGTLPDKPLIDIDKFPITELAKRGWIVATNAADRVEEVLHDLISYAGGINALPQALLRQGGARENAKTDIHALQAWCLHVLGQARQMGLEGKYQEGSITPDLLREVARLSQFESGPKLAKEKLAQYGIALVVAAHLPKTYLDGAALKTCDGVPVVCMTLRYDRIDNFWFCLLHELAHLGRHFINDADAFIDDLQLRDRNHAVDDDREREADEWAQEALIPQAEWTTHPARSVPSAANVISLARAVGVNPAIVAGRIRHERKNYRLLSKFMGLNAVRPLLMEGAR
ncbi:MAG: helix-turn-helix domain-containing protein [Candidatus Azotimanducaceae bacterium WSBS_2022_MAG_OTU7]